MTRFRILAGALPALLLLASGASAAPITMQFNGFENGYTAGAIAGIRNVRVAAGQFDFGVTDDGGVYWDSTLNAFCIDVATNLVTGTTVTYDLLNAGSGSYLNGEQLSLLGQLFDSYAGALGSAVGDAAFQLAIWEIVYDFGAGALDLLGGSFAAGTFGSARTVAQGWLDSLTSGAGYTSSLYELFVLSPVNPTPNQTLITWRAITVPTPATLALFGAGLLLIGFRRRRRHAQ